MPQTKTRVIGSGFTTFNYRGQPIAFLDGFTDTGQRPVGAGMEPVHPLDKRYPAELATARALNYGTLTVTIRELWNEPVWYQLVGLTGTKDILAVWDALAADPAAITCQMLIKPPGSPTWRGKTYHNCVITDIDDSENVAIGQLTMPRNVTIAYTHTTPLTQPAAAA
jgi:hypothetical protein